MILDQPRVQEHGGSVERSVRVRWDGGEHRLSVTVPAELAPPGEDLAPFVCTTLLPAMRRGEDLEVDGPVSAALLGRAPRIVDLYASWDPRLFRTRVTAGAAAEPAPRAGGVGSFFSRGVDSLYSAATPRGLPGPLTHLVYCDRLEPIHGEAVRREEIRLAREAAAAIGLPLVVIESNVRELTDPIVVDWEDMVGGGLSFLGLSLAGGLGHVVIPSSDGAGAIGPCGTSPLLDPLFSTERVEIEHDTPRTRAAKVGWLARERRDLLPWLKVCYYENRPDNCGRCSKCLLTMLALEAAGARELATAFPDELDLDAVAEITPKELNGRLEFAEVHAALREGGAPAETIAAVGCVLENAARVDPSQIGLRTDTPGFRKRAAREAALLTLHGPRAPEPPGPSRRAASGPRTTVMMPAYEAAATVREAVMSVLGQTVAELELIVVDDGSTEPVSEVLTDLRSDRRLRILRHGRNRGLTAARNAALRAANAPLVSQLDADDMWELDYLESILPCFDDPAVGLAYTNATILGHPEGHADYIGDPTVHPMHDFPKIAEQNPIPSPTATMRTAAVRAVGGYARWLRQAEDYHLYMKLAQAGWRFAYVHRRLARYRWPQPDRGMSFEPRRHELWELAMFGSFVAAHPRTPGPRRQVRTRLRREAALARAVVRSELPEPPAGRPRVYVEPGSHDMLNLGDIAMLQVCVERLERLLPGVSIGVITGAPDRLARHLPGVEPIPAGGMYAWLGNRWDGGAYSSLLGRSRDLLRRAGDLATESGPAAARAALRAEIVAREPLPEDVRTFLSWLLAADGVVVSGRGGLTDAFRDDALRLMALLRIADGLGATVAMMGQGVGPARDERLRATAREVLPRLELVAVRERLIAPGLLESWGLPRDRAPLTGDDALELAHRLRPEGQASSGIGVSLRVAEYSGVDRAAATALGEVLAEAASRHGSELTPVPISLYPHESDGTTLARLLDVRGEEASTPRDAIELTGRCRVVLAGSYHAGVFALAQGVPVVGVTASPYYAGKLEGLADLYPSGCTVVSLAEPGFRERLAAALDQAWEAAPGLRDELLAATERQIEASRAAYARLAAAISPAAHPAAAPSANGARAGDRAAALRTS
jgi:polysaccharide pyruvyl transferase WcaK-like protein